MAIWKEPEDKRSPEEKAAALERAREEIRKINAQRLPKQIYDLLMPDEEIICDQPPSHATGAPHDYRIYGVVFTNQRIIFFVPSWFRTEAELVDFRWTDLRNVLIKEGFISSEIIFEMKDQNAYSIGSNQDKGQMRKLHSLAADLKRKAQEHQAVAKQESIPVTYDPVQKLKQLKSMLDNGLITQSEYDSKKADILTKM